jgi:hypothetical protein
LIPADRVTTIPYPSGDVMPVVNSRTVEVTLRVDVGFTETNAEAVQMAEDVIYRTVYDEAKLKHPKILSITVITNA